MKRTKEHQFIELFRYWTGKLGLKYISLYGNRRFKCHAVTHDDEQGGQEVSYNIDYIRKLKPCAMYSVVFHEIGHMIYGLPYGTKKEIIQSEITAEKFALNMLLQHYPKYYEEEVIRFRKKIESSHYWRSDKLHAEAFSKIKEYGGDI